MQWNAVWALQRSRLLAAGMKFTINFVHVWKKLDLRYFPELRPVCCIHFGTDPFWMKLSQISGRWIPRRGAQYRKIDLFTQLAKKNCDSASVNTQAWPAQDAWFCFGNGKKSTISLVRVCGHATSKLYKCHFPIRGQSSRLILRILLLLSRLCYNPKQICLRHALLYRLTGSIYRLSLRGVRNTIHSCCCRLSLNPLPYFCLAEGRRWWTWIHTWLLSLPYNNFLSSALWLSELGFPRHWPKHFPV